MKESGQPNAAGAPAPGLRKCLTVNNTGGLNARAAAMLVRTAQAHDAQLFLESNGQQISARSIMQILSLEAARGAVLTVCAEGPDAAVLLGAVEQLFASRFADPAAPPEPRA